MKFVSWYGRWHAPGDRVRQADLRAALRVHRDAVGAGERAEVVIERAVLQHDEDQVVEVHDAGGRVERARAIGRRLQVWRRAQRPQVDPLGARARGRVRSRGSARPARRWARSTPSRRARRPPTRSARPVAASSARPSRPDRPRTCRRSRRASDRDERDERQDPAGAHVAALPAVAGSRLPIGAHPRDHAREHDHGDGSHEPDTTVAGSAVTAATMSRTDTPVQRPPRRPV